MSKINDDYGISHLNIALKSYLDGITVQVVSNKKEYLGIVEYVDKKELTLRGVRKSKEKPKIFKHEDITSVIEYVKEKVDSD